jgi:hypothetical protein
LRSVPIDRASTIAHERAPATLASELMPAELIPGDEG